MSNRPLSPPERERLVARYITALDRGDAAAIEPVLDAALYDPALDQAISDIDAAYLEEAGLPAADAADVAAAIVTAHLGRTSHAEAPPLLLSSVAARLLGKNRVPSGAYEINSRLLASDVALPEPPDEAAVIATLRDVLGAPAPPDYADAFALEAVRLRMSHTEGPLRAAARTPHPSSR